MTNTSKPYLIGSVIRSNLKKIIPSSLLPFIRQIFHGSKAILAATWHVFPARKLQIIGVTGTKGKTTTSVFIGRLLNLYGLKTGYITTSVINLGEGEFLNPHKMTTVDSFHIQKYLTKMISHGCRRVILEMSSQGLEQNRHYGLGGFDTGVFLNIYPEHIEAHGSWEKYKQAKSILFRNLKRNGNFLANKDFAEYRYMWRSTPPRRRSSIHKKLFSLQKDIKIYSTKGEFTQSLRYKNTTYPTALISKFDVQNAYVAALTISHHIGNTSKKRRNILEKNLKLLPQLNTVPGRMEWVIKYGKNRFNETKIPYRKKISVLVDYAHEPASMELLLKTLQKWKKSDLFQNIIHVLSSDGAGRDDWKKPVMGSLSSKYSDYTVLTTDNYTASDNPQHIVDLLKGDIKGDNIQSRIDRSEAFKDSLLTASTLKGNTVIVSTGVGSEQGLTQPEGVCEWDERFKWIELYKKYTK